MAYLVSTKPDGDKRWWHEDELIPSDHSGIRPATHEEARLMDKIMKQNAGRSMPSVKLGEAVRNLMAAA